MKPLDIVNSSKKFLSRASNFLHTIPHKLFSFFRYMNENYVLALMILISLDIITTLICIDFIGLKEANPNLNYLAQFNPMLKYVFLLGWMCLFYFGWKIVKKPNYSISSLACNITFTFLLLYFTQIWIGAVINNSAIIYTIMMGG